MDALATEPINVKDKLALIKVITEYALACSDDGWVSGEFYNCHLSSAFQPIIDFSNKIIIGHAAYIRTVSNGEIALSPWQVFALALKEKKLVELDHLCRAVHALNYFFKSDKHNKLFIDVHPRLLESAKDDNGRMLENLLSLIGINTKRVVIEIPSAVNRNWNLLRRVILNYRSRGYQIAVNYSGLCNEWTIELDNSYPDIINIHASDLLRHENGDLLGETIHRHESTLLVSNIKTPEHVTAALDANADYLQGNYLHKAERTIKTSIPLQLAENFDAERWDCLIPSINQEHNDHYLR
ncbi:MAG: EAL domain-containing protein [Nitrosomonas sp.]|nr:EAL domain-containing protein [Nitrosomonas sp.]